MPGRKFRWTLSYGGVAVVAGLLLVAGLEFVSTAQSDLPYPCQQIANQERERIRGIRDKANAEYTTGMVRCRRNGYCEEQVRARRTQAETLIKSEESALARRLQACKESYDSLDVRPDVDPPGGSPGGGGSVWRAPNGEPYEARPDVDPPGINPRPRVYPRNQRRPTRRVYTRNRPEPSYPTTPDGDWDPNASTGGQNTSGRTNQYGDWLPDERSSNGGDNCQGMVDAARQRIREMQNNAAERYRVERSNCGRDLGCLNRAKENAAQRGREINEEQARLTRQIRDCQAAAKNRSRSTGEERTNQYGDWLPPAHPPAGARGWGQWQGVIDYSRERIRKMQNAAAEDYQRERIRCAGGLDCLRRAREHAAQRSSEIREEDARLSREIRDCQARARNE